MNDLTAPSSPRRSSFRQQSGKPKRAATTDFTLEAPALIEALDSVAGLTGPVLEPAAGRGHMAKALRDRGVEVVASELDIYPDPLIPDIAQRDLRDIDTLDGFAWVVTNLPYSDPPGRPRYHDELARHLIELAATAQCGVALLVRNDASTALGRRPLLHGCATFAGKIELWRPIWVEGPVKAAPQHPFCWLVWSPQPRPAGTRPWLDFRWRNRR
jgi:hypothetical protein